MENYLGSQQHWEDNINDDYDERERRNEEQVDDREQPDDREPQKNNSTNYQKGLQYKQMSEDAKHIKQPWQFLMFDIESILAFRKFELESK